MAEAPTAWIMQLIIHTRFTVNEQIREKKTTILQMYLPNISGHPYFSYGKLQQNNIISFDVCINYISV